MQGSIRERDARMVEPTAGPGRQGEPKTRRASEVVALTTRRNREGLVERAAEQRSPKAGQMEATQSCWARRASPKCGEN